MKMMSELAKYRNYITSYIVGKRSSIARPKLVPSNIVNNLSAVLLTTFLFVLPSSLAVAEDTTVYGAQPFEEGTVAKQPSPLNLWGTVGIGCFGSSSKLGIGSTMGLSFARNDRIISLNYTEYEDLSEIIASIFSDEDVLVIKDLAVLYGVFKKTRWLHASASIGVGYTIGEGIGEEDESFSTYGFPYEIDVAFTPIKICGIGAKIVGSMNPEHSFAGVVATLKFGNFR
jgi:hypothetical protein